MNTINIGKAIREELDRQERTVAWLARNIHTNRAHVYRIFHSVSVDSLLLLKISIVLGYNFFEFYTDKLNQHFDDENVT